ncbi:tubulin, epsilon 1 [Gorgonomyces haynaldii]|nr:tubulin, epsilon 1 [Gorgonomyces haynaldii]
MGSLLFAMSQTIVLQVGQCGNQIGHKFWDLALQEHSLYTTGQYDDALSSFFRDLKSTKGGRITGLRARSVLIDMEPGVLGQIQSSSISELFDKNQYISSDSGSGNNWSVGYHYYPQQYAEPIFEAISKQAEACDSLQSFFVMQSTGGGTGSGLGSFIQSELQDLYPDIFRFSCSIVPSPNDDVVTSPYNSLLSLAKITEAADCILPVDNQSLFDIYDKISKKPDTGTQGKRLGTSIVDNTIHDPKKSKIKAYEAMNQIVSNMLLNMTSSMRFQGTMNVDINDIVTNLVPFPRLNFLTSGMTPLYRIWDLKSSSLHIDQMFQDAFLPETQLVSCDPRKGLFFATAIICRGPFEISDVRRNIDKLCKQFKYPDWNQSGWKTGLCDYPSIGQERNLLALSNNTSINQVLERLSKRFKLLLKRKAHLHHYLDNMDLQEFLDAQETIQTIIKEYAS